MQRTCTQLVAQLCAEADAQGLTVPPPPAASPRAPYPARLPAAASRPSAPLGFFSLGQKEAKPGPPPNPTFSRAGRQRGSMPARFRDEVGTGPQHGSQTQRLKPREANPKLPGAVRGGGHFLPGHARRFGEVIEFRS